MLSLQLLDEQDNGDSQQDPTDSAEMGLTLLRDDGCLYNAKLSLSISGF